MPKAMPSVLGSVEQLTSPHEFGVSMFDIAMEVAMLASVLLLKDIAATYG